MNEMIKGLGEIIQHNQSWKVCQLQCRIIEKTTKKLPKSVVFRYLALSTRADLVFVRIRRMLQRGCLASLIWMRRHDMALAKAKDNKT
jgi:hypothetical protein